MLSADLVESLLTPISDALPCGDDLEYDASFTSLASMAQGKPEQQFGETLIAPVPPDWRSVADEAATLLGRSKDLRLAVLALRAAARQQGVAGVDVGLQLVHGLLERYWDDVHPALDAEDGNDPTMRLNALMPLIDEDMVLRDLFDASVGETRVGGALKVRDLAAAFGLVAPRTGESALTQAQAKGALAEIAVQAPAQAAAMQALYPRIKAIDALVTERTGNASAIDLAPLRAIARMLSDASAGLGAVATNGHATTTTEPVDGQPVAQATSAAAAPSAPSGQINNRQEAQQMLERVIRYLQQVEPGNPAPLLIRRAQGLIGVSFFEIMNDLAPDALDAIRHVTGGEANASTREPAPETEREAE